MRLNKLYSPYQTSKEQIFNLEELFLQQKNTWVQETLKIKKKQTTLIKQSSLISDSKSDFIKKLFNLNL